MKWKVIPPTDYPSEEKEAVLSLEGPNRHNEVCLYCHVNGKKYTILWLKDGKIGIMSQVGKEKQDLQSVGFNFDDIRIATY